MSIKVVLTKAPGIYFIYLRVLPITILVDKLGVSLLILDVVFAITMVIVFYVWYKKEDTLSIHEINNDVTERFYWVIVLTTFVLEMGVGDTISDLLNFGYLNSLILFGGIFILSGVLDFKVIGGCVSIMDRLYCYQANWSIVG